MISFTSLLTFIHIIGLAIGVGAATVKLVLLFKCKTNHNLINVFVKVSKPITQLIIFGLILLTLSGIGWIILGYSFTSLLIVKIVIVAALWIIGPIIDNVIEPKFNKFAATADQHNSPEFVKILNKYLMLEVLATGLFYIIIIIWVLI